MIHQHKAYFVIGSSGRTATQWLTKALRLHHGIAVIHGPDPQADSELQSLEDPDVTAARLHRVQSVKQWRNMPLAEFFDRLSGHAPAARALDSIHAHDVYGLLRFRYTTWFHRVLGRELGNVCTAAGRRVHFSMLVRHPVPRVNSFIDRWQHAIDVIPERRTSLLRRFGEIKTGPLVQLARKHSVDLSTDAKDWLFPLAVHTVCIGDRLAFRLPVSFFTMEKMTTDIDYFAAMFTKIVSGQLHADDEYLAKVSSLVPVDIRHRAKTSPANSFAEWKPWQQELFRETLYRTHTKTCYESLGYDLQFIT